MRKFDTAQLVSIFANVAVLIGILLLIFELSQNRAMMEGQTRSAIAQGFSDHIFHITEDAELTDLYQRGNRGEELTALEQARYTLVIAAFIRYYENAHYQYRQGLYSESEFQGQLEVWRTITFAAPGFREQYCGGRALWSPDFVREIDGILEQPCE